MLNPTGYKYPHCGDYVKGSGDPGTPGHSGDGRGPPLANLAPSLRPTVTRVREAQYTGVHVYEVIVRWASESERVRRRLWRRLWRDGLIDIYSLHSTPFPFFFSLGITSPRSPRYRSSRSLPLDHSFPDMPPVNVMRRPGDSWINATHILQAARIDKGPRTRILARDIQVGQHEKIQGGFGKHQGTWWVFFDPRSNRSC